MLDKNPLYNFFKPGVKELNPQHRKNFSTESKSEVFIIEAIQSAIRCNVCGGFVHVNSIQIGHEEAIEDGGIGNADNGKIEHPYCNSIKKDLIAEGFYKTDK